MRVTLLYFAAVADRIGRSEEVVSLPDDVDTVGSLRVWLEGRFDVLAGALDQVRFAVDERFVEDSAALTDGVTVAAIPPVAGG